MNEKLEKATEAIQAAIMEELKATYSEKVINAWLDPRHMGKLQDPQGLGKITGPCGDTMEIALRVRDDQILEAKFLTDGCITTIAAGNMAAELAAGKTVTEAFEISQQEILQSLDGLPETNQHCALLASNTLKEALRDYLDYKREPWKRDY